MKRCGIYLRVSQDSQTTENQLHVLQEVAARSGWTIVTMFEDHGISGAKGRDKRPGYDALLKAISRREVDIVAAWLGTHVDAPHHFLNDGRTVENLPLDVLTGPCYVVQLPDGVEAITAEMLERMELTFDFKRILYGTSNSHWWKNGETKFQTDFVAITEDGAEWLVKRGVQLVGVDYLSVAPYGDSVPTHTVLLKAGVVVVEGLNLSQVSRGFYDLYCLPLKIAGSDGAPARAILIQS